MIARILAWLLVATTASGCGPDGNGNGNGHGHDESLSSYEEESLAELDAEIDGLIEEGHALEPLPALTSDELAEREVRMHRAQVADGMRSEVAAAMAPLAFAAALFAPGSAVELLLAVVPGERLGEAAVKIARKGIEVRRRSARAKELTRLSDELEAILGPRHREFLHMASTMTRAQRRALTRIHKHTGSPAVAERLLYLHYKKDADVVWIAAKLESGRIDARMAERFTFDAGLVEDITMHDSGISWKTLQEVVDGMPVDNAARDVLAIKMTGLMGERAARDVLGSPGLMRRYVRYPDVPHRAGEGITYKAGPRYGDERHALDILAFTMHREALFVEVKTWSSTTWGMKKQRDELIEQLRRHDWGIDEIMLRDDDVRTVKGKILMVAEDGYLGGMSGKTRETFEEELAAMGWKVETMPSSAIPSFADVIDGLR